MYSSRFDCSDCLRNKKKLKKEYCLCNNKMFECEMKTRSGEALRLMLNQVQKFPV
jgi:hypothetical protein